MLRHKRLHISDYLYGYHAHQMLPYLLPDQRALVCRHVELEYLPKKKLVELKRAA